MSYPIRPLLLVALCAGGPLGCDVVAETASGVRDQVQSVASEGLAGVRGVLAPAQIVDDPLGAQPLYDAARSAAPFIAAQVAANRDGASPPVALRPALGSDAPPVHAASVPPAAETSSTETSCLPGHYAAADVDNLVARAIRRQAQRRKPTSVSEAAGRVQLVIAPNGRDLSLELNDVTAHYRARLAGIVVDYRVRGQATGEAAIVVAGDHLVLEWSKPARLRESVRFGHSSRKSRSAPIGLDEPYRFECNDDGLTLTAVEPGSDSTPIFFRRTAGPAS